MKTAVILFNLGGPLNREGVYPFLLSLFSDPSILKLPNPFRKWLATYIAWKRTPKAQEIYKYLGGGSPLLENTKAQAAALERALGKGYKVFIVMRHAPPFVDDVIPEVQGYDPSEIVLLPLYPQFSTTTTGSSLKEWNEKTKHLNFQARTKTRCCYPELPGFIKANVDLIQKELSLFQKPPRILFSAHGLPEKTIRAGDPYVSHVERTAQHILKELLESGKKIDDAQVCYQSRVGPLQWTKPDLDSEIKRTAEDKKGILIVPLSFVSEHSETLVELDITYRDLAQKRGVPEFGRVPTVSCHPVFIQGLVDFIQDLIKMKICEASHKKCWRQG